MAYLSAGVYVVETDKSAIVPTVSNAVAFFAGEFTKGVIEQPFMVTNKNDLINYFGLPTNENYNQWFQCSKFLEYGNQLVISRAFTEGTLVETDNTVKSVPGSGIANGSVGGKPQTTEIELNSAKNIHKGSIIEFQKNAKGTKFVVNSISLSGNVYKLEVEPVDPATGTSSVKVEKGDKVSLHAKHQNSEVEIEAKGKPAVDKTEYSYDIIKNYGDFEVMSQNGSATLAFDGPDSKLKFFAQTPGETDIEISIVNPDMFADDAKGEPSKAEAFEGLSVFNFFQYPPRPGKGEYGVIIRDNNTSEVESYVVSDEEGKKDQNNKSMFVETLINENSKLVYVKMNDALVGTDIENRVFKDADGKPGKGAAKLDGGLSPVVTATGSENDITKAYDQVKNKELFEVDIIIGNERSQGAAISLAKHRKDCIAFIGAEYSIVGKKSAEAVDMLAKYVKSNKIEHTMFAAFFGNYHRIYDNYNKKFRWINCAGDMAGLRADTNTNQATWWASAGLKRGVIRNIQSLAFSPDLAQRDVLYKNGINPIVSFPGEGNLCWGNKTLLNYASAFDRVNVRGLFNTLERAMAKAARSSVFDQNDVYTRNSILAMFNPFLSSVKAGRGIDDFLVVCDTSNNTPDVISRNELHVDIYIKPAYAAEFIQLNFVNAGTNSFASIIG